MTAQHIENRNGRAYRLLLFDIDGTLISTGRAGTRAMNLAFEEMFDRKDGFSGVKMAGRTDPAIIRDGMRAAGLDAANGAFDRYCRLYLKHLDREMKTSPGKRLMPGIGTILERASAMEGLVVGLLTGNMQQGAQIKLDNMGILHHFELGAFGSDDDDRNRLLAVALDRYRRHTGRGIEAAETMVVGDTPHDIECSKPFGATAVAVATGPYKADDLRAHEPDHLFETLENVDAFLALLGTGTPV